MAQPFKGLNRAVFSFFPRGVFFSVAEELQVVLVGCDEEVTLLAGFAIMSR